MSKRSAATSRRSRLPRPVGSPGLRDPIVGQSLAALHGQSREIVDGGRLARLVGLSRSVLAERFTDMVGQPPMQYLALWRMQLASRLLVEGGQVAAGCQRRWLRIRGGVQSRVQEARRTGTCRVAASVDDISEFEDLRNLRI